jgi:hypothetical protein
LTAARRADRSDGLGPLRPAACRRSRGACRHRPREPEPPRRRPLRKRASPVSGRSLPRRTSGGRDGRRRARSAVAHGSERQPIDGRGAWRSSFAGAGTLRPRRSLSRRATISLAEAWSSVSRLSDVARIEGWVGTSTRGFWGGAFAWRATAEGPSRLGEPFGRAIDAGRYGRGALRGAPSSGPPFWRPAPSGFRCGSGADSGRPVAGLKSPSRIDFDRLGGARARDFVAVARDDD